MRRLFIGFLCAAVFAPSLFAAPVLRTVNPSVKKIGTTTQTVKPKITTPKSNNTQPPARVSSIGAGRGLSIGNSSRVGQSGMLTNIGADGSKSDLNELKSAIASLKITDQEIKSELENLVEQIDEIKSGGYGGDFIGNYPDDTYYVKIENGEKKLVKLEIENGIYTE